MDHDEVSRSGSANSAKSAQKDRDAYVPVNYISPEAYALLAAAEASAARKADALDTGVPELDLIGSISSLQISMFGLYDPERILQSMSPPKKFYRTFWQSISLRRLDRSVQAAWQSAPTKCARFDSKILPGHDTDGYHVRSATASPS